MSPEENQNILQEAQVNLLLAVKQLKALKEKIVIQNLQSLKGEYICFEDTMKEQISFFGA